MSKHTPGPWKVAEGRMGWDIIIRNAVNAPVCSAIDAGYNKKTAEANACLIAAAPDMLEALKVAQKSYCRHNCWYPYNPDDPIAHVPECSNMLAIIAKAEGTS